MINTATSIILLLGLSLGFTNGGGLTTTCLSPTTMTSFNATAFNGRWYPQYAAANYPLIGLVNCGTFDVWSDEFFIGVQLKMFGY